jgi:hypothetical protein
MLQVPEGEGPVNTMDDRHGISQKDLIKIL